MNRDTDVWQPILAAGGLSGRLAGWKARLAGWKARLHGLAAPQKSQSREAD